MAVAISESTASGARAAVATLTATHAGAWGLGVYVQTADGQYVAVGSSSVGT